MSIKCITESSNSYPRLLKEIASPPKRLFCRGVLPNGPYVAVIGSRIPTDYGKQVTYRLAYDLARAGVVIVSGLAYGVDSLAHRAALDAGGRTVAVLGSGLDTLYPERNRGLAEEIIGSGAVITEYALGTPPLRHHFPARNRIIAGLALGVLITEAQTKSGSLITAARALEANRQVMAVPGNITSQKSAGPNYLIKLGAAPITNVADIISLLDIAVPSTQPATSASKTGDDAVLILIERGVSTMNALVEASRMSPSDIAIRLTTLEIAGKIRQLGGGQWVIVEPANATPR